MNAPSHARPTPDVDHLTRDYRGLREHLIELVTRTTTAWTERSAADVGMVVLENLAYMLDHLAYAGDRVAAEGFLRTARSRQSVRLHAALGDYSLDRGSTSHGYQHFTVLPGQLALPRSFPVGPRLEPGQDVEDRDVFETLEPATLSSRHNRFTLRKSVAVGATLLWLGGSQREALDLWATGLRPGTRLALVSRDRVEMVVVAGVQSSAVVLAYPCGAAFIAGGSDRAAHVVGNLVPIRRGRRGEWKLLGRGGAPRGELAAALYYRRRVALVQALVDRAERHRDAWRGRADLEHAWMVAQRGATLAVCRLRTVSTQAMSPALAERIDELLTEAADALRSLLQRLGLAVPAELQPSRFVSVPNQRVPLPVDAPVVWYDDHATLEVRTLAGGVELAWTEVEDFLRSGPTDRHYVVEIVHDRDTALRFGDGERGAMVPPGAPIMTRWVVGDPSLGDVGRDALTRPLAPHGDRLDPLAPTSNPLATIGARRGEPLERVADRLRVRLAAPAIPITRGDHIELLEQQPGVVEAAVLPVKAALVRVSVRLEPDALVALVLPALRRWCERSRLAGTRVRVSLARPLHVSVTAVVRVHVEAEPEAVQARCKLALRALFGDDETRRMGLACTRSEVLRVLEAVNGVEWSELHRFDRASARSSVVREHVTPAADQLLRCIDDPAVEATGRLTILVACEYSLHIELRYADPDLMPQPEELHAALLRRLSGLASIPRTKAWAALTVAAVAEVLATAPFTGPDHALRLRTLIYDDRSVDEIPLRADDVPTLRSLQLIPVHIEEVGA